MAYSTIKYDVSENILTITLSRPEKLNAFTGEMMAEMIDAFDRADADDDVRAIPFRLMARSTGATKPCATVVAVSHCAFSNA